MLTQSALLRLKGWGCYSQENWCIVRHIIGWHRQRWQCKQRFREKRQNATLICIDSWHSNQSETRPREEQSQRWCCESGPSYLFCTGVTCRAYSKMAVKEGVMIVSLVFCALDIHVLNINWKRAVWVQDYFTKTVIDTLRLVRRVFSHVRHDKTCCARVTQRMMLKQHWQAVRLQDFSSTGKAQQHSERHLCCV